MMCDGLRAVKVTGGGPDRRECRAETGDGDRRLDTGHPRHGIRPAIRAIRRMSRSLCRFTR
jgi:hypothetical protein